MVLARRASLFARLLLVALLLAATPPLAADETSGDDASVTLSRLFLVRLGEPDLPLEVRAESGAAWSGRTDADGRALFRLEVADDDVLAVRSADPAWTLAVETPVRNAHLDPGVALELDLADELEPAPESEPQRAAPAPTEPTPSPEPTPAPRPRTAPADPCDEPTSLECRLRRLRDLEAARGSGDCHRALAVAEEMGKETPEFVASDAVATTLAELHLECSLEASRAARTATDPTDARLLGERAELLARRGLQIALGTHGRGWCDVERSQEIGRAHV